MKMCRAILLIVIGVVFAACWADPPAGSDARPDVKDADAQRIIHVMDAADAKAYADYLRAVQKIHHDAFAKLNTRKGELTRLGKLDDAVSIRDFIDFVTKQDADNAATTDGAKLLLPVEKVVGEWDETNGTKYMLLPNGRFTRNGTNEGIWKLDDKALTFVWMDGQKVDHEDVYDEIISDGKRLHGHNDKTGNGLLILRPEN